MNASLGVSDDQVEFGDYVAVLARRRGIIIATVAIVLALTAAFVSQQTPTYDASTTVLVRPITRDPLDSFERPSQLIDLSTEAQIVTSTSVGTKAAELLDVDMSVEQLLEQVQVEAPDASQLLLITFSAGDAQGAADGARAFANAYLDYRGRTAAQTLASSVESIQQRLDVLNDELESTNATIAKLSESTDDPRFLDAQAQRSLLTNQIALLSSSLAERLGVDIAAGDIIGPANVPETPSSPNPTRAFAIATVAGLLLGVALAFVRQRLDDRVDTSADAARAAGTPVLATVRARRRFRLRSAPTPAPSEVYRRVALAVTGHGDRHQPFVVLVVSGRDLPERSQTASRIAMALARDGRVLLVDGAGGQHGDGSGGRHGVGGATPMRTSGARERDAIVVIGERLDRWSAPGAAGLTVGAVAGLVEQVGSDYDVIVVDARPVLESADALELRAVADCVVVVARLRATSNAELRELRAHLASVGMQPVGVVLHDQRRVGLTASDHHPRAATGRQWPVPAQDSRVDGDERASGHAHV